jgi:hypothetical protein
MPGTAEVEHNRGTSLTDEPGGAQDLLISAFFPWTASRPILRKAVRER